MIVRKGTVLVAELIPQRDSGLDDLGLGGSALLFLARILPRTRFDNTVEGCRYLATAEIPRQGKGSAEPPNAKIVESTVGVVESVRRRERFLCGRSSTLLMAQFDVHRNPGRHREASRFV